MLFFFLKILFVVSIINIIIKVKIIKVIIIFAIIIIINHHHKLFSYSFNCCYYIHSTKSYSHQEKGVKNLLKSELTINTLVH